MTYGMWLSAAGMRVNQYRMNTLSNNMANVNTTGFKEDIAVFRQRQVESRSDAGGAKYRHDMLSDFSGGTFVAPTYHSFTEGPMRRTGGDLDVAVKGEGFFAVRVGNEVRYTRDGAFTINDQNELVLASGDGLAQVLDEGGAPLIMLPSPAPKPVISADGTIRQGKVEIGKISLAEFADRNTLRKVGANLFKATGGRPLPVSNSSVLPGMLEGSTVSPVASLAEMIEVTRAYQLNANLISLQDSTIGQAVSRIGRVI